MQIVPQSTVASRSYFPNAMPLLAAPHIAGLLPAATPISSTPIVTVHKRTDPDYLLSLWRSHRPQREYPDAKTFLYEKIIQAQERLEARFAQLDEEIAAIRRRHQQFMMGGEL
jgi:hypothetical protein